MIASACRCAKISFMKTLQKLDANQELFEMIRTHQCLLKIEHEIEFSLKTDIPSVLLIDLLETLRSLIETLNTIILNHSFWKE